MPPLSTAWCATSVVARCEGFCRQLRSQQRLVSLTPSRFSVIATSHFSESHGNERTSMEFSGEEQFTQGREELYAKLVDLEFMSKTFPGLKKVVKLEPKLLVCKLKPGFSFISGTLTNTMELVGENPPESVDVNVHGKGIGASVNVRIEIKMTPDGDGTTLAWLAKVTELGGLLKPVPRPLIEAAASKVVSDTWAAFRCNVDG